MNEYRAKRKLRFRGFNGKRKIHLLIELEASNLISIKNMLLTFGILEITKEITQMLSVDKYVKKEGVL